MAGIEVHYVFPYIEERVCVGLCIVFPLSIEVYFRDFGFDIFVHFESVIGPVTQKKSDQNR